MLTQMTTAWGAGTTNLIVYGGGFIAALCTLAIGVAFFTSRTFLASLNPAFTLLVGFWLLVGTAVWLRGRRVGGRVLLDVGPRSYRNLVLLLAAWSLIGGLWGVGTVRELFSFETIKELVLAAVFLFTASGRLQIRENGIWEYGSLLRWHKVVSYRWTDDGTLITYRRGYLTTLRGDLPVPPKQREAVNALLLERAPQAREP